MTPADRQRTAARVRRYRARQRRGEIVLQIAVDEHCVAAALIDSGRLAPEQTVRRSVIERELAAVLRDWAARWKKSGNA